MNTDEIRSKIDQVLKQKMGLNDEMVEFFLLTLQPLVNEYIDDLLKSEVTEDEVNAIILAAMDEGSTQKEISAAIIMTYEEKVGHPLQDDIDSFMGGFLDSIDKGQDDIKARMNEIAQLPQEQWEEEFKKDILKDLEPSQNE
ncbi:hypothetical protein KC669_01715 [Candidatus Dojkabacteria bacterium]|uniref:Uncharacterized protein n=1 Tax=Candidatus Dojkabacteria bacterium TaxID=2099670 RepID=A0A955LAV1_9BACT|nr:hypothetical protein [Candidatus Dojkabacteria bacterium]